MFFVILFVVVGLVTGGPTLYQLHAENNEAEEVRIPVSSTG